MAQKNPPKINMDESQLQSMFQALTTYQQEQVKTQIASYHASIGFKGYSSEVLANAVSQFRKTLITKLFEQRHRGATTGTPGVLTAVKAPPPPAGRPPVPMGKPHPPSKGHPLSMRATVGRPSGANGLVDRSNGLLGRLLGSGQYPVGLQDWVGCCSRVPLCLQTLPSNAQHHALPMQLQQTLWRPASFTSDMYSTRQPLLVC